MDRIFEQHLFHLLDAKVTPLHVRHLIEGRSDPLSSLLDPLLG